MATTTKTVFLTDENGNLLVDSNGRPRALTFTVIEGKSLRLAEREIIPTVTYAELKTYSESVQTYTGITNTAKFSVEDVAVFQYIVSDRGNTRAYITAQVSAVNDTSLTANGIGISVAGADGKNGNDGVTPRIGDNKHWYIGEEDTGIVAEGKDGTTPHIGENKHWYIGEEDTGIIAEGKDGATPEIGENGNWYINGKDTGKSSKGADGDDGVAATIQIGKVTTLPAGSQATAENVGTETEVIIDFGIPQGAKGDTGEANVVANPSSDTINRLAKIEINGTIYNITRIINAVETVSQIYESNLVVGGRVILPRNIESNVGDLIIAKFENIAPSGEKGILFALDEGVGTGNCTLLAVISDSASGGEGTPIIDLGEVTLAEQSLGNISMAMADNIEVTLEQATLAQADNPPIVKIRFDNDDHEFFRTKISTDASAAYVSFTATEETGERTKFYYLQITILESGGASASLLVLEYRLVSSIINPLNLGYVTFADGVATISLTDEQNTVIGAANALQFTKTGTGEVYWLYRSQIKSGGASDAHDSDFSGIVSGADGLTAYVAYLDGTTLTIKQVAIGSGGGSSYTLPIASATVLGGVQPVAKSSEMTQGVGVDELGKLWTVPTSGGSQKITKEQIATALGCSEEQLNVIVALSKKISVDDSSVQFASGTTLKATYFDAVY